MLPKRGNRVSWWAAWKATIRGMWNGRDAVNDTELRESSCGQPQRGKSPGDLARSFWWAARKESHNSVRHDSRANSHSRAGLQLTFCRLRQRAWRWLPPVAERRKARRSGYNRHGWNREIACLRPKQPTSWRSYRGWLPHPVVSKCRRIIEGYPERLADIAANPARYRCARSRQGHRVHRLRTGADRSARLSLRSNRPRRSS
jgi:hypothetical protein